MDDKQSRFDQSCKTCANRDHLDLASLFRQSFDRALVQESIAAFHCSFFDTPLEVFDDAAAYLS